MTQPTNADTAVEPSVPPVDQDLLDRAVDWARSAGELTLGWFNHPELDVEGEMHGDAALDSGIRMQIFPNARMREDANLLIFPTLDAANIAFNLLKTAAGDGVTIGPILLGAGKPVHILTPTATVRRIVNMTALTVVEAGR